MKLLESPCFCLWCQAWSHCRSTVQPVWVWSGNVWGQTGAWKGKLDITSTNWIPHLSLTVSRLEMKVTWGKGSSPPTELHSCLARPLRKETWGELEALPASWPHTSTLDKWISKHAHKLHQSLVPSTDLQHRVAAASLMPSKTRTNFSLGNPNPEP